MAGSACPNVEFTSYMYHCTCNRYTIVVQNVQMLYSMCDSCTVCAIDVSICDCCTMCVITIKFVVQYVELLYTMCLVSSMCDYCIVDVILVHWAVQHVCAYSTYTLCSV